MFRRLRGLWRWLPVGCLTTAAPVSAQLYVDLKMENSRAVAHEPVNAIISLHNRSGQDVKLNGPGGRSWLRFQVYDHRGVLMTPRRGAPIMKPRTLGAGKSVSLKVNINAIYPINQFGTYRILASAYYPPGRRYFDSESTRMTIDDGRVIFSRAVGSGPNARRYNVLTYRDRDESRLYYRLINERTKAVRKTYSIGRLVNTFSPQIGVDARTNLHVFYMGAPREFMYVKIKPDGKVDSQTIYEALPGSKPKLVSDSSGSFYVDGGQTRDSARKSRLKQIKRAARIRKLSERPIGF